MFSNTQKFTVNEIEQILAAHISNKLGRPIRSGFLSVNSCGGEFTGMTLSFDIDDTKPKTIDVQAQDVPEIDQSQLLALIAQLQPLLAQGRVVEP